MKTKSRIYQFVSIFLTVTLFTQTLAPALFPAEVMAHSQAVTGQTAVSSLDHDLPQLGQDILPQELTSQLLGTDADGLPPGILMDVGVGETAVTDILTEPAALANPLSLSRVQSAYVPSGALANTLTITFTVRNNRPPTLSPSIPVSATITETADILANFDFNADPNTIHNVILADTLTGSAVFQGGSPQPDQNAADFVFNLGDVPPMGSVTATLTVAVPASVIDFTELDIGATAYGSLQGRPVLAATTPATLAPDSFADYLRWTPDADIYDTEMLQKAAELGADPTTLFTYVRGLGYESYQGSLRGTRGTLWGEAGNSLDQASLLIAMLRAHGVPARYAHGTLNTTLAQELILSMFPEPVEVIGHIPPGTDVSDPANDPALLAETSDHWWVEAYIGGQWLSLDPTFAYAQPGDAFATAVDILAEAPDDQRHKVTLQLKVERYTLLSAVTGDEEISYPLTATFNTVELAGRPLTLNHLVNSSGGGAVFTTIEHTYVPYLVVGDYEQVVEGAPYQDIFSNFAGGLGNIFATGAWLQIESTGPDGNSESYEREIKDLIGPAARQAGGVFDLSQTRPDTAAPLYNLTDIAQVHVLPYNQANSGPLQQQWAHFAANMPGILKIYEQLPLLDDDDPAAAAELAGESFYEVQRTQILMLDTLQKMYSVSAQEMHNYHSGTLLTHSYVATPKFLLLSGSVVSDSLETSFELLNVRERIIPYPQQNMQAAWLAQMLQSIDDKVVEASLIQQFVNDRVESAYLVMEAAQAADAEMVLVTPDNLDILNVLDISEEAKARITKALNANDQLVVQVPREMVLLDGREQIGWAEIDMETGYLEYVYENGRRAVSGEYGTLVPAMGSAAWWVAQPVEFLVGLFGIVVLFGLLLAALLKIDEVAGATCRTATCLKIRAEAAALVAVAAITLLAASLCAAGLYGGAAIGFCLGLAAGVFLATAMAHAYVLRLYQQHDPPLPNALTSPPQADNADNFAKVRQVFTQTQPAGALSATLTTPLTQISQQADLAWMTAATTHAFTFSEIGAASATLYQNGGLLAQGALQIEPNTRPETAVLQGPNISVSISGNGRHAFHATALPGLGAGNSWRDYTAVLTAGQPYTLTLAVADITVNSTEAYTGTFTLVVDGDTAITGSGLTAAPDFATAVSGQLQDGHLLTGPAHGIFLADGQPLDVSNGVAVAGYTGPITVTENSTTVDQIEFAGEADFFTLHLSGPTTTDPLTPITLIPAIEANFTDAYTLTAEAPPGWNIVVADTGPITATPPSGAAPDNYLILVTAQSSTYPDLFVSAFHTVTTTALEGMALTVTEDTLITVPMGPVLDEAAIFPGHNGHVDNGRAEVPGAAYAINLTNTSTISHPFDVFVSGLPAGWLVLSGAAGQTSTSLTLPPGAVGQVGLYISPTVSTILPPGTSYTLDITASATDGSGLGDSQTIVWTMPAVAFPYLKLEPTIIYALPDNTTAVDLELTNIGNSEGTFSITNTTKANIYGSQPYVPSRTLAVTPATFTSPALDSGQASLQALSLDTTGALPGEQFLLTSQSTAGEYQPAAYALVQIVSPHTWPIFEAANQTASDCTLGEPGLSAALQNLALAMNSLEATCTAGSCSLADRDEVVTALNGVTTYAAPVSPLITADTTLQTIASEMATHSSDPDLEADIAAISTAVANLAHEVCELSEHQPDVRFTPYLDAVLLGDTATFTLAVTNQGSLTTGYSVTATTPTGSQSFNPTLAPGETAHLPVSTAPAALGSYDLNATVVPTGPDVTMAITETAVARLNVVDKFVQVTAVTADPPFVETGASSTTLAVEVNNVANVARLATARVAILSPTGTVSYTADTPLTLLVGPPRAYELGTVDTSGWAAGVYTLTVELLDAAEALIVDGQGVGYLGIGQALQASHALYPSIVSPGTVTVTTVITTELGGETILPPPTAPSFHFWPERPLLSESDEPPAVNDALKPVIGEGSFLGERYDVETPSERLPLPDPQPATHESGVQEIAEDRLPADDNRESLLTTWAITRTENSDTAVIYTGSWTAVTNSTADFASNGDYHYSQTTGDFASFSFSGTWIGVGFVSTSSSGYAELFVDGVSQGLVDLYSRNNDLKRVTIDSLPDTAHVITVTVTGIQNPFSNSDRVNIDTFDTWDGTEMPAGAYEQDDGRIWLSDGWVNQNDANASGGSYYRSGHTAWFPFTSDSSNGSLTFQAMTYANSEKIALYLDDDFQGYYDIADFNVHTRTFTFDGLAAGPHMLTVRAYRGAANIDVFTTPASEPATPPPVIGSFHRYEENEPTILYNGFPFPQTDTTWFSDFNDVVSDHYMFDSGTAGDTISFTFSGVSVGVGFYASTQSGYAEIFIDGISQGIVDAYRREPTILPVYFHNLPSTSHTLTINVLGQKNPFASNDVVHLDYIDVWDGTPLPDGTFEELDGRLHRSYRWSLENNPQASGGQYLQDSITGQANVWFPFSGDSITFHALAESQGSQWTKVYVDGQPLADINLYNNTTVSRTYSFNNLGSGLHILTLERYRGELLVDAFTTPGTPPFTQPPATSGIVRYEEDDPALRYNGVPYRQRPQSWSEEFQGPASGGYTALSTTAGDTVSLTFDGRWVSAGFFTHQYGGQAEIFVDGVSQGTIGLYSANGDVESFTVGGLLTGTHTISITVLGMPDPPGTQARVHLDYINIWDGQAMLDEIVNASQVEHNGRIHNSYYLNTVSHANAINGDYLVNSAGNPETNTWYAFTGDSFSFYGFSINFGTSLMDVFVDGAFLETVDVVYPFASQPLVHHYDGLGEGPHVVRISNNVGSRVDAFASNQPAVPYRPLAEWWESDRSGGASIWGGVHVPPAVGDVTGDGAIEIVVASSNIDNNGELFLMRGDGQDAGGGDPIIWSVPFNIFNGFEDVGAPAIAELDGQPGAEIVMATVEGMYAFHSDGSTYWFTDTVQPHVFFGTPAVGNLDLDAEPEIVINMDEDLVVFEPDGAIAWTYHDVDGLTMPLLVDLTGDGLLDILFHDWNNTLALYDYNLGNPQLVWTAVFANPPHGYGAPAVADLDGDGTAEVAIATETVFYALNSEDGSVQWSAPLDPGRTGGVTIADLDGDGEMELVTSSLFNGGTLYAFEADGTPKWTAAGLDTTPLNVSAADLDGDGAFELLWNGVNQGFTIYDGATGAILFNEPLAFSATGSDFPVTADVDLDGYAEIVVPAQGGIRVFGFDGVWGPARPVWNQLNYHVTNIEDDLTVPFNEVNSWQGHNTYRTQTAPTSLLPSYQIALTHTVGVTGVAVLSDTFSVPPAVDADPVYGWAYSQSEANPVVTRTFASLLTGLKPGEAHLVAQGTSVRYTLPSGSNQIQLPPLYATVPHIVAVSPATQTVGVGGTAVYAVVLSNPTSAADLYALSVAGLPADWLAYPPAVSLAAGAMATVSLTVTVPATAVPEEIPFIINVTNGNGHNDQASASLLVIDGLAVTIDPPQQTGESGVAVTYTLTLTNLERAARAYNLTATGLADVTLPTTVTLAANGSVALPIQVVAANSGPHPFTVSASTNMASGSDDAVLNSVGDWGVDVVLTPDWAVGGPGTPAVYTLAVSNLGSGPDTYDLSASLPAGWSYRFVANGADAGSISLAPHVFNQADIRLLVTPDLAATPGDYAISVMAQSQGNPVATAVATATVQVLARGVQAAISPAAVTLNPTDSGLWQVTITNTGSVADNYWLTATGIVALSGQFSTNPVSLSAGQSADVTLITEAFPFVLATTHSFAVVATSQNDDRIQNQASAEVTFTSYEAVDVTWQPPSLTITDTLTASFMLLITNTGNIATTYDLSVAAPGLSLEAETNAVYIPPHMTAAILVTAVAAGDGVYTLTGQAASSTSATSDAADAILIVDTGGSVHPPVANDDTATTEEDTAVIIDVLANDSDLDGDVLIIDSVSSPLSGTVAINTEQTVTYTPTAGFHGEDSFSYTISDGNGGFDTALVQVTVLSGNHNPVAVDDTATTEEDIVVIIEVLANDYDLDDDLLTVTSVTPPDMGTVLLNPEGSVTYTPDPDARGLDSFNYTISDGRGGVDTATVIIFVENVNDPPVAADDQATTIRETAVIIDVLANDSDVDNNTLHVESVTQPAHGSVSINLDNTITYTPEMGFDGLDIFTYVVSDGQGGIGTATVTVEVFPIAPGCNLYPIALHADLLADAQPGDILADILNGVQPGNFGWLTWTGNNSVPALIISLTPPGNSDTYINVNDPDDHIVSIDDWVVGKPGVSNSIKVQNALNELMTMDIAVPIWDTVEGTGSGTRYQVSGFATVRLLNYDLSGQDQITVQFLGFASCDSAAFGSDNIYAADGVIPWIGDMVTR